MVGQTLRIDGHAPKTALFDASSQSVNSTLVKLYISELDRVVQYKKDFIRPKLRKLRMEDVSVIAAIHRYEIFKRRPSRIVYGEDYTDDDVREYVDNESSLELLHELYDDACDYARSEEEGWFYSDTDSEIDSIPSQD